jgi:CO/xanthine dehydrogenase FAD-binding subunit
MTQGIDVLVPSSAAEAVSLFGDGAGVTVIGGGTIVMPEITYGRLAPSKALFLPGAGLSGITADGETITVGATTPVNALLNLGEPLRSSALNLADVEIRMQGTVGGNICARGSADAPRGDLQGPLIALGARVRSVGAGGESSEPIEDFLPRRENRLVLDVSFEQPATSAWASLERPHTHEYTSMAVTACRHADGSVRLGATGVGAHGLRLRSAEAKADDPTAAGTAALADVQLADDAVASGWYREQTLPVLVRRVLTELREAA